MAARVVLPPSGTALLFVAPRNAVAARLTCRKRFRPIYSCSRIRMDYSPVQRPPRLTQERPVSRVLHQGVLEQIGGVWRPSPNGAIER